MLLKHQVNVRFCHILVEFVIFLNPGQTIPNYSTLQIIFTVLQRYGLHSSLLAPHNLQ